MFAVTNIIHLVENQTISCDGLGTILLMEIAGGNNNKLKLCDPEFEDECEWAVDLFMYL